MDNSSHRLFFLIFAGALSVAVLLGALERVWPRFQVSELPVACAFRRTLGYPCPGCGLTRSWVALGQGDLAASVAYHRLGWMVMVYVALQAIRHGIWLWVRPLRPVVDRLGRWLDRSLILLAAAMFVSWGMRLAGV